jgi:phosphoglycolate phosphatase
MARNMTGIGFDVVGFDLDGTLADTAQDLAVALNHALGHFGRPAIPDAAIRKMVGHGARALLRRGFDATGGSSEALVERAFPLFRDFYAAHICEGTIVYPGLERALDALAERGIALAICTNKPELHTLKLVEALGWNGRFAGIVGADTLGVRKPDPATLREAIARAGGGRGGDRRAVFVGDSITDADTARAAGVPLVAVSFGFSDRPVESLGADAIIDHYDDLLPALARLSAARTKGVAEAGPSL